jgi:ubiquitin-activating enzyme E1
MIVDTQSNVEIDTNLYSRQIGTFGMEAMGKLIQMKVLIWGMRGLGFEVAKNIVLAGPKQVTLFDKETVSLRDLGSNFYLSEEHVGKVRRDSASSDKLKELNPYVTVDILENEALLNVKNFNVIVITEVLERKFLERLNEECRKEKVGFIYSAACGISGWAFVDFGNGHLIRDENGEECKQYIVRNISRDHRGIVLIDDTIGSGKLTLSDGDWVVFREVGGMNELNDAKPREITYVSPIAFSIGDTSSFSEYNGGGIIEQVKVPKPHNYKSLTESFESPYNGNKIPDPIDLSKFGRNELLHCAVLALHEFLNINKSLPDLNNEAHAQEVLTTARGIFDLGKKTEGHWVNNSEDFKDEVVLNFARWSRSHIVPVTSFLGGLVAQEIVKYTGKYSPIDQWIWFDFTETVANLKNPDRAPMQSRYDDQVAIYGREIQERLQKLNLFMIGAGALGCEFLKEFSMMGISTEGGQVIVTDNDNIEVSNLNRQFLFRRDDVHHSKSQVACGVVKKVNTKFNCADLQSRVGTENEHIFNDEFWTRQDFVINAVDNVHARKYIDSMCTWYGKNLIDSGTLGTKAHVQMIVPHVTSCYNDTQDPPEESIPMCTLHNFPAMIEHCIEWGRDHFNGYFADIVKDAHKLIEDPSNFYAELKKEGNVTFQLEKLTTIKKLIEISLIKSFDHCIEIAIEKFTDNFDFRIQQLLYNFPAEYTNPDGSKFWSGSKRVPSPIRYDANDETHLNFVATYAILIAKCLSIEFNPSFEYIKEKSKLFNIPEFKPKKIKIKVNDQDNTGDDNFDIGRDEEVQLLNLITEMSIYDKNKYDPSVFKPEEFEKDDDSNFHIDFINATSNLRARNYRIKESDRQKTKMIAGKIIPAIATTTACITGLVALQIYTLLQTKDISFMRNTFLNLAVNLFILTEPAEKIEQKDKEYDPLMLGPVRAIPKNWTVWDRIVIQGPLTFQQLMDHLKNTYNVEINIITASKTTLLQTFIPSNKSRYNLKIEDVYNTYSKYPLGPNAKYLVLEISADTEDGAVALLPLVQYNFK